MLTATSHILLLYESFFFLYFIFPAEKYHIFSRTIYQIFFHTFYTSVLVLSTSVLFPSCLHLFILHLFKLRCGAHFLTIICCLLFTTFSLGMHFSLTCAFPILLNFSEWMRLILDRTIPPEGLAFGADPRKDVNSKILLFIERVAVCITYLSPSV